MPDKLQRNTDAVTKGNTHTAIVNNVIYYDGSGQQYEGDGTAFVSVNGILQKIIGATKIPLNQPVHQTGS